MGKSMLCGKYMICIMTRNDFKTEPGSSGSVPHHPQYLVGNGNAGRTRGNQGVRTSHGRRRPKVGSYDAFSVAERELMV